MKVVFYRSILEEKELTPTDKILFCQILYMSIMEKQAITFDSDGEFSLSMVVEDYDGYVPISWRVKEPFMTELLRVTKKHYYLSYKRLVEKGYIRERSGESFIRCVKLVPFFELQIGKGLKGLELIVYSYLFDKAKRFMWVDKYHNAIAEKELHMTYSGLAHILAVLSTKGFLERMRKGHQVLLRTKS